MQTTNYAFRKSFSRTSVNGITFHWLRYTYGKEFDAAIAKAVWIVYSSSAFAASPETWSKVTSAVIQSREIFYQMMEMAKSAPKPKETMPLRVEVFFKRTFEAPFDEARVYEWLLRKYGDKTADFIVHAVWLVYSPAALSASQESGDAQVQLERSRLVFEDMMTWAIARTSADKTSLIANRLDKTLLSSSIDEPETRLSHPHQAEALPSTEVETPMPVDPPDSAPTAEEEETVASDGDTEDDFDDDYVPPNYDLDFGN